MSDAWGKKKKGGKKKSCRIGEQGSDSWRDKKKKKEGRGKGEEPTRKRVLCLSWRTRDGTTARTKTSVGERRARGTKCLRR